MPTKIEVNFESGTIEEKELTPAEIAAIAAAKALQDIEDAKPENIRLATDITERKAAILDPAIMTMVNQTRAEWGVWAQASFPSLTAAERTRLGTICWLLAVAIRRILRSGG